MKFLITIPLLIVLLFSCGSDQETYEFDFLHIANNTDKNVKLSFYLYIDTSLVKSYSIKPYEARYFDTTTYRITYNGGESWELIYGDHLYPDFKFVPNRSVIWNGSSYAQYEFESYKRSHFQDTDENCWDNEYYINPCLFKERTGGYNGIGVVRNSFYEITDEQYLLADSI